ncbi:MAG: hypothetical protein GY749_43960 [Desulfobacteraceae bacterium]|nr:hypothetical protein [Desulfobacteraceae bacterium]
MWPKDTYWKNIFVDFLFEDIMLTNNEDYENSVSTSAFPFEKALEVRSNTALALSDRFKSTSFSLIINTDNFKSDPNHYLESVTCHDDCPDRIK